MKYWISPSGIDLTLEEKLRAAGLKPFSEANNDIDIDAQEILLIYSAPDQALNKRRVEDNTAVTVNDMLILYDKTLSLSNRYRKSSSGWRLNLLDTTSICRFCNDETPQLDNIKFPSIQPLAGLLTQEIIKREPKINDIYLDLELRSCLFGLEADSRYLHRLNDASLTDLVLMDWWEANIDREAFHEEVMNNLAQLTQIQNDFDTLVVEIDELRQSRIKQRTTSTLRLKENKDLKSKIDLITEENKDLKSKIDPISEENKDLKSKIDLITEENKDLKSEINLLTKENSKLVESTENILSRRALEKDVQASEQNRGDGLIKQAKMEGNDSTASIKSAATDRKTIFSFMLGRKLINIANRNPK